MLTNCPLIIIVLIITWIFKYFYAFWNHMLPWIWKILAKCTFLIQIHQLQGSIHSDATPGCRVLIQAWVILHVSAALAECWLTNIDIFATAKITFTRGIGCFCRCGSPKCLIKPVFMKSMESHDWWDTELPRQQRLRPCPGLFDWKAGNLEPCGLEIISPSTLLRAIPRAIPYLLPLSLRRCINTLGRT